MMNTHEQRIREFAYQIWESEGKPFGQETRHWDMACKLAMDMNNAEDADRLGSSQSMSMIAPEDGSTYQTDINSTPQQPAEPIAPVENPPQISPTPPAQPIHPADPVQPDNPSKPVQPYTSKRTSSASKAALDSDGTKAAPAKKPSKPRKSKTKAEDIISL